MDENNEKPVITRKIDSILASKNLSRYRLSKLIDYKENTLNRLIRGEQSISKAVKEKLLPILEISAEEFDSWILADKYPKELLEMALTAKKEVQDNETLILTTKIDEILKPKALSRTALSKIVKHPQSSLNNAITGKEPMSDAVVKKIAPVLEVSEEQIKAWRLADKYLLKTFELAINLLT